MVSLRMDCIMVKVVINRPMDPNILEILNLEEKMEMESNTTQLVRAFIMVTVVRI